MRTLLTVKAALCLFAVPLFASAQTVSKTALVQNGLDSEKLVMAIIGDGYTAADIETYKADVKRLVMDDLFTEDKTLFNNRSAFNIYRIDAESAESGVSEWNYKYDETNDTNCTPTAFMGKCWERDMSIPGFTHDTALGYVANDTWARCWFDFKVSQADTEKRIQDVLSKAKVSPDFTLIILNTSRGGGCGGGNRATVTRSEQYGTVAHEMGHAIPGMLDEYFDLAETWGDTTDESPSWNSKNCSTQLDKDKVAWADLLEKDIPLPTFFEDTDTTMDADETVGMFEGCDHNGIGIYRPVESCRMRHHNGNQFCPVCQGYWESIGKSHGDSVSDYMDYANYPGALCKGVGRDLYYSSAGISANNSSSSMTTAVCPARRFTDANGSFSNRFFATAWVRDRHPSKDICCRVRTRNPGGTSKDGAKVCTSGSSSSRKILYLDFPKVYDPYTWSHVEVLCDLPVIYGGSRSEVLTYRVGQQRF